MKKLLVLAMALFAAFLFVGSQAQASPSGSFLNSSGVPAGSKLVVNITYKAIYDVDSGLHGNWALDSYTKHVQVWQVPDGTFYAVARYVGKWQTFATALSPQNGQPEGNGSGTFQGGYTATFSGSLSPINGMKTHGSLGTYDFGGTEAMIGQGQSGYAPGAFDWVATYFPEYSGFTYVNWGWTYKYRNQTWVNSSAGNSGDIVVP